MWNSYPLSSPPARALVRRRTAEADWFERLQEVKPLIWPTLSSSASSVHEKRSSHTAVDLRIPTKSLCPTPSATIEATATEQGRELVVPPSKVEVKHIPTHSSSK